ncbi:hypothetical protein EBR21_02930 [bacterium]|nr:hypothetical protein [bacterium]
MLAVRCRVSLENQAGKQEQEWVVLRAERNSGYAHNAFVEALSDGCKLHVFASTTAQQFFLQEWSMTAAEEKASLAGKAMFACGVGNTTDQSAGSLTEACGEMKWTVPVLAHNGIRLNGLAWTLNRLEELRLVPRMSLHLWTKINSTSEKILEETKRTRKWNSWDTRIHEIYDLNSTLDVPEHIKRAIANGLPICFGVRSAEVLDATVHALLRHCQVANPTSLAQNIHFSVWEKGAQQRAQQLMLQQRLVDPADFDKLLSRSSP